MAEFTPTQEDMRKAWIYYTNRDDRRWRQRGEGNAEFDRFLDSLVERVTPRAVTTVAELDALSSGSILRDNFGQAWNKVSDSYWHAALWKQGSSSENMRAVLPATVLFIPTGKETE